MSVTGATAPRRASAKRIVHEAGRTLAARGAVDALECELPPAPQGHIVHHFALHFKCLSTKQVVSFELPASLFQLPKCNRCLFPMPCCSAASDGLGGMLFHPGCRLHYCAMKVCILSTILPNQPNLQALCLKSPQVRCVLWLFLTKHTQASN